MTSKFDGDLKILFNNDGLRPRGLGLRPRGLGLRPSRSEGSVSVPADPIV